VTVSAPVNATTPSTGVTDSSTQVVYNSSKPVYVYDNYDIPVRSAPIVYHQPQYSQPTYVYPSNPVYVYDFPALQASCYPSTYSTYTGNTITWYASVSGGSGSYTYSWSGTDSLYGSYSSVSKSYYNSGTKYAYLNVYSGNQNVSVSCNSAVTVYNNQNYYPNYVYQTPVTYQYPVYKNTLDIGCFVDPGKASVNQPVTWSAEVTGGMLPYTYSWTGSDGLSGNQSSIIKYYGTSGEKSAVVTVTSADGKTNSRACSNTAVVKSASTAVVKKAPAPTVTPTPTPTPAPATQTSNLFSLGNVPWGWVAILVIFVLFGTVMYLLFNRPKI